MYPYRGSRLVYIRTNATPWLNVPEYRYEPKHGNYVMPPIYLGPSSVIATPAQGGCPEMEEHLDGGMARVFNPTQQTNIIRLVVQVFGGDSKDKIAGLIGGNLNRQLESQFNNILGQRIGATPTTPLYHMVQENVESYDLGVKILNLARTTMPARTAAAHGDVAFADRQNNIAAQYQMATLDLQNRALEAIDEP